MNPQARAERFLCHGCWLVGVVHLPPRPAARGLLMVTGGPQYRAGSHRQFVLLARQLAAAGIAVMRFDYRGMGDSEGAPRDFERIDDDLAAAVLHFCRVVPALRELVLWGLCDGASAAAFYAPADPRVSGLVLLNPWVRTAQGMARATLRHYYLERLAEGEFWRKLAAGRLGLRASLASLRELARQAAGARAEAGLPERLRLALERFPGRVLFILGGADLGAREFSALPDSDPGWRALLASPRVRQVCVAGANHTFARADWRAAVANHSHDWITSW
ncbi:MULTISPECIES: hydrolase 1, exosortase A system-associated [Rugamonas]|uniref:Exosortase A system-associated hydrolase 1 n=1 Tax=Rugamonas rubra TaxID=758825 RepID=A0A1I4R4L1_9BURK|nr:MULTISPECIES: hydrolase 1, exosortase A system-associated [Rugamonas]WGG52981.1 hydrolase 1, exosortase A system-associated [Rugamonas sp. DEMB1]SFM47189.1 exosortase A system-associated hydrolase 1 [Rugamonas rubra]